ncbi:hypothetical protein [Acetobacter malorum]|uniref:hypothetical protein n=1 Tax=Acetobacter malorum TaxID=178901 RepID=UPI0011785B62|nr:hypothetical protein [Acetobacter malorum]
MNECNIFKSFLNSDTTWREVERLSEEAPEMFHKTGLSLDLQENDYDEASFQDVIASSSCYSYKLFLPKSKKHRGLLIAFEMYRPVSHSSWEHSNSALITCAYTPAYKDLWSLQMVLADENGYPADDYTRDNCYLYPDVPELVVWGEKNNTTERPKVPLDETDWFFSIPLSTISNRQAFFEKIVLPCSSLLKGTEPASALAVSNAVRFNEWSKK